MERYFYFGQTTTHATGDALMMPLSRFLGMDSTGAAQTTMNFKSRNNAATNDDVVVTHTGYTTKEFMDEVCDFLQENERKAFLMMGSKGGDPWSFVTNKVAGYVINTEA